MRELIRKWLHTLGYDIVKVNQHNNSKANKRVMVNVGGYPIVMPGNNPQISNYKYFPDLNKQLARLVKAIESKYHNMHMVDIGANVGDTIAIVKEVSNVAIVGIEGDPVTFSFLKENTQQFNSVAIFNNYLSEKSVTESISFDKGGWNTTLIPDSNAKELVHFLSIDDLLQQHNLFNNSYKLLKIDIEGYDTIVLRGALQTIFKHNPVLYIEYNLENMKQIGEEDKGLQTLLQLEKMGYNTIAFFDHKSNIILKTSLHNSNIINQLHYYGLKNNTCMPYYDICIFHSNDEDIAISFLENEANKQ